MVVLAFVCAWPTRASLAAGSDFAVTNVTPENNASGVLPGANVIVRFNRAVDKSTVNADTVLVNDRPVREMEGGAVVFPEETSCAVLFRQRRGNVYTVTLTTSVRDRSGTPLAKPYTWRFATASGAVDSGAPPRVFVRYPRLNDMRVPTNVPITMIFTDELDPASVTNASVLVVPALKGPAVSGKVDVHGTRLVFRPDDPLKPQTTYEVHLAAGIKSKSGNEAEPVSSWQFTTGEGPSQGPIVADCWYESYTDDNGTRLVFHAATENLVQPNKPTAADKPPVATVGALPAGHTVKAAVVPLAGLLSTQPLSTPTDVSASDLPISSGAPPTVVQAAYTHGGGSGQGNSVGANSSVDPAMEKVWAAVDAALAGDKAVTLHDSGNAVDDGDQAAGDGVYSGRMSIDKSLPTGLAFVAFSITQPDGKRTQPVTISLHVIPTSGPNQ